MKYILPLFFFFITAPNNTMAQNNKQMNADLPYREIPAHPKKYSSTNIAARMIDGLGFRYYWATEGLRPEDLAYKPSGEARTSDETLDHILGLSQVILNAARQVANAPVEKGKMTFAEKRKKTLENIKAASDILKNSKKKDLKNMKIIFKRGGKTTEYPYWNMLNGPIADAIWHCGQVVSFRRASGNPFDSKASLLTGKLRE